MLEIWTTPEYDAWIRRLRDNVAKAQIAARLDRLERTEHLGDWKSVGGGIIELRIDSGPGYRLYCKRVRQSIVLLISGGEKRMQRHDILRAKEIARKWQA